MTKEKTEEHGNMVINLEKIRLHTEQQVKTKRDIFALRAASIILPSCAQGNNVNYVILNS
jgi:hypothetical protein